MHTNTSFPAVNLTGGRISTKNVFYEGADVTQEYFLEKQGIVTNHLPDVRLYVIKDYSMAGDVPIHSQTYHAIQGNHRKSRRRSVIPGNDLHKTVKLDNPNLLEQSQTYRGLSKQISNRLGDTVEKKIKSSKPIVKKMTDNTDCQTATQTVFPHVCVSETPKEALENKLQQKPPELVYMTNTAPKKECTVAKPTKLMITSDVSTRIADMDKATKIEISSYAIRQQYGQHLERNLFKSFSREVNTKNKEKVSQKEYLFTPEMWYSPEPDSDEQPDDDADGDDKDEFVNKSANLTGNMGDLRNSYLDSLNNLQTTSANFSSMDVLVSDADSHDGSDIDIVLKNGQLLQRRVKNKMHKQRKRKMVRFQQFLNICKDSSDEDDVTELQNMSDKELRFMRLKLKKPKCKVKSRGIARFRQVVKSVLILLYFSRRVKEIRKARKAYHKRKECHRTLGGVGSVDDNYAICQTQHHKSLKERFLEEMGWKLAMQVADLTIRFGFGYELPDHASGGKHSHFLRLLEEWFPDENFEGQVPVLDIREHKPTKRGSSCPELITPKEFRVIIGDQSVRKKTVPGKPRSKSRKRKPRYHNDASWDKKEEQEGIGVHNRVRRNSFSVDDKKTIKGQLDLRDLLKDVQIPAKEIKIQIAERKLRRQKFRHNRTSGNAKKSSTPYDAKKAMEANRFKLPEFDFDIPQVQTNTKPKVEESTSNVDLSEHVIERKEEPVNKLQSFSIRNGPFLGTGISWHKTKANKQERWTNEELDHEIQKAGSLFLEMRHCRYIRWDRLGHAMMNRMFELENEMMYSLNNSNYANISTNS